MFNLFLGGGEGSIDHFNFFLFNKYIHENGDYRKKIQAETEVVPSSSLVEVAVEVKVGVEVGVEVRVGVGGPGLGFGALGVKLKANILLNKLSRVGVGWLAGAIGNKTISASN